MAHLFERTDHNPYAEAAHQVEAHAFSGPLGYQAGASEEIYGPLSNAIVTALGDIGHQAFRLGVNDERQMRGLAQAVAAVAEQVLLAYQGEVAAEPALEAMQHDPRLAQLGAIDRDKLEREIGKTRQLEALLLNAMRLPDLMDYAGSVGLQIHQDAIDQGELLVPASPELPSPQAE